MTCIVRKHRGPKESLKQSSALVAQDARREYHRFPTAPTAESRGSNSGAEKKTGKEDQDQSRSRVR
ncbi:hypothetical protein M427DRAFT_50932 [Gonapodya prolifera JEL478]|uniref:Uncharacterized protein n=1 Tax=Gonapodya prolifera (strain JEL478) TaxID=1344416 RepID=A0A139AXR4_GONPJ|nr:hypothetical protein M427DRAFT_50932 [Gonapodya prolifera JEL478]|eukprot:KXS21494.1 hypothetical protein M427DRAFT_50932 [Gonapodya prolifera JEL478]